MKNVVRKTVKTNNASIYSMVNPLQPRRIATIEFGERVSLAYAKRIARAEYGENIYVELTEQAFVYEMSVTDFMNYGCCIGTVDELKENAESEE